MNHRLASALNVLLMPFGRKLIEAHIGHWYTKDGKLHRESRPLGYHRLARRDEWQGLPDTATEMDRFIASRFPD